MVTIRGLQMVPVLVFLDTLRQNREEILQLALEHGASQVRVFGSVARGDDHQASDVDLLVCFPAGYDMFSQRIPLTSELAELLERPVDLIPEHELSPYIRDQVLSEAIVL